MPTCNILGHGIINEAYEDQGWLDLCCWKQPSITYNEFLTGITETYNNTCLKDRVFSDYVTQLYTDCLSGGSSSVDTFVSAGTLNASTGVVTFTNTTGGTVAVSGFDGFDSYWSANTNGSISNSGLTGTYVGIGTNAPDKTFHVKTEDNTVAVFESTDNTCTIKISDATDDAYIVGKNNMLYISDSSGSPSSNAEFAFDYVNGKLGIATTSPNEVLTVAGSISGNTHLYISGNTNISGATSYIGAISGTGSVTAIGGFVGNLTGTADVATVATTVTLTDESSDTTCFPVFAQTATGNIAMETGSNLTFNSSSGLLTSTQLSSGSLAIDDKLTIDNSVIRVLGPITIQSDLHEEYGASLLQINNPINVGVDDTGCDVQFFGASAGQYMKWEESTDELILAGDSKLSFHDAAGGENIIASSDGHLEVNAGTTLDMTAPTVQINASTLVDLNGDTDISATLKIGSITAAGAGYTGDKILVSDGGNVEYLTTAQLKDDMAISSSLSYWSANTNGTISSSGLTNNVGIGTNTPNEELTVKGTISADTSILVGSNCIIKSPEPNSVFIGADAGANWESNSISNTALGRLAMGTGTMSTASQNTALGFAAFAGVTTGDYNTAVGLQSLSSSDTGSWNTALGKTAMYGTTYHSYNTGIGANALYFTTSSSLGKTVLTNTHNTAIGYSSQYYSIDGAYNTSVGSQSIGNGSVTVAGTGNTAMGYESMKNSQTGSYNLALGYKAGDNITTGDYNISIGPDADPPSATADYQMNIGGIIHGQDAYSDSAISQVGIGTTGPKVKLDVHHDPTNLADNTGGGEVVTFGTEDATDTLAAGRLMFLNTLGIWEYTDANTVTSGATQLLGIALGTSVSDGILLRGFFDQVAYIEGAFAKGAPCYVSEAPGEVDFTAPSASSAYVRVIGYGTDLANVIYFNPDNTWVELS